MLLESSVELRDLDHLNPEFSKKLQLLVRLSAKEGFTIRTGCTLRGPAAQGRLWCRSRSIEQVATWRSQLADKAPTLAACLRDEWASLGPSSTNKLPGQSWHQFGEAADLFAVVGSSAIWNGSVMESVAAIATKVGLYPAFASKSWTPTRYWHVQLRREETPLLVRGLFDSWPTVEKHLAEKFLL